jgi:hypothetical protein
MHSAGEANRGTGKARNRCSDAGQTDKHSAGEANRGTGKSGTDVGGRQKDMHSAGEANRGTGKVRHIGGDACQTDMHSAGEGTGNRNRDRDREPYAITARQPTKLTAMELDSQIAIG